MLDRRYPGQLKATPKGQTNVSGSTQFDNICRVYNNLLKYRVTDNM